LKRLIKLTKLSTSSIEKNIVGVLTNKAVAYTKLPIFASEELASIIGNAFGDGYVSNQKFKYVNKRKELVIKVKENMRNVFGVNGREFYIKNKKCYGIEFPGVVGKLLIMVGAPNGRKTIQKTIIPAWIKRDDSGIKSNFLKTLFDDDGSVCLGKYQKFITISFYKNKSIVSNLIKFLNELRELLKEKNVFASKVLYKKDYKDTQEFGFRIYGFENLKNFYENIGFDDYVKYQKLLMAIRSYNVN